MAVPVSVIDAFAEAPFAGNPAAVCRLTGPREPAWMQRVAAEMNLSETAFVWPQGEVFCLRWHTPTIEVALCGHATLATAHALWTEGGADRSRPLHFETASGMLTATARGDLIELDFPLLPVTEVEAPSALRSAIGFAPVTVAEAGGDLLVQLDREDRVRRLDPDISRFARLRGRGVCITAAAEPGQEHDFVSRFFAPAVGIPEDPVTGSVHCALAPFWQARTGKSEMVALQVSDRGGRVEVRIEGDRVILGGRAVTVLRGEILV